MKKLGQLVSSSLSEKDLYILIRNARHPIPYIIWLFIVIFQFDIVSQEDPGHQDLHFHADEKASWTKIFFYFHVFLRMKNIYQA